MKLSFAFLTLISSCAASVVPLPGSEYHDFVKARYRDTSPVGQVARVPLEPRANSGQQLTNPDSEPPYTDPTSGSQVDKSRILSGTGFQPADDRYFDWDESCSDADERLKIATAWEHFQPLVDGARHQLKDLRGKLPKQPVRDSGNPNEDNRKFIHNEDPAYAQMFKARDTGMAWVQESYKRVSDNVRVFYGRNPGKPSALRFICDSKGQIKDGNGDSFCGTGAGAAQAITLKPLTSRDAAIEDKYRFEKASSITFCPAFFDDNQFPNRLNLPQGALTLDQVDCRERIILHEYMHLQFTRDMNPGQDKIGYVDAASVAATLPWTSTKSTPDCYAWYALYAHFNQGCTRDAWPNGVNKPVKV